MIKISQTVDRDTFCCTRQNTWRNSATYHNLKQRITNYVSGIR